MNKSRSLNTRTRKGITTAAAVAIAVSSLSIASPSAYAQNDNKEAESATSVVNSAVGNETTAAQTGKDASATKEKDADKEKEDKASEKSTGSTSSQATTSSKAEDKASKSVLNVGGGFEGFFLTPTTEVKDGVKYSAPADWGEKLSPEAKAQATVATYVGKIISQDPTGIDKNIDKVEKLAPLAKAAGVDIPADAINSIKNLKGKKPEQISAALNAIMQKIEAEQSGNKIDVSSLDKGAKEVYDAILKFAPLVPESAIKDVNFVSRTSEGEDSKKIIALDDIDLKNIPVFDGYDFGKKTHVDPVAGTETKENSSVTSSASPTTGENGENEAAESPSIAPNAKAVENVIEKGKDAVVKVKYSNLTKGETYTIKGVTVDRSTGNKTGNEGSFTFVAEEANGEVEYSIKIDNADIPEQSVYTYLYKGDKAEGNPIAKYEKLDDADQLIGTVRENPEVKGSVTSSTGDIIQSGTEVDVNTQYTGLVPGKKYKVEARLVNADNGEDTGALKEHEFTADVTNGSVVVRNLAVTNPDITRQTAFLKLYEMDGSTPYLIAAYEKLGDAAMTFGATHDQLYAEGGIIDQQGKGIYSKKKKKVAPKTAPAQAPVPVQQPAPAAAPLGSGGGGGAPAGSGGGGGAPSANANPRQVINSVPSGDTSVSGNDIFSK